MNCGKNYNSMFKFVNKMHGGLTFVYGIFGMAFVDNSKTRVCVWFKPSGTKSKPKNLSEIHQVMSDFHIFTGTLSSTFATK